MDYGEQWAVEEWGVIGEKRAFYNATKGVRKSTFQLSKWGFGVVKSRHLCKLDLVFKWCKIDEYPTTPL